MRPVDAKLVTARGWGLCFVLTVLLCAEARADWNADSTRDSHYSAGKASQRVNSLPATMSPYPLGSRRIADPNVMPAEHRVPVDLPPARVSQAVDRPVKSSGDSQNALSRSDKGSGKLQARGSAESKSRLPGGLSAVWTTGGALAIVLGLFFVVAWIMRRAAPRGSISLPGEVVEVLGRTPLTNRQQAQLVRVGRKLLLLCVTNDGAETLTEITDPLEVDRLTELCRQSASTGATTAFRQVLDQFGGTSKTVATSTGRTGGYLFHDTQARGLEGRDV